MKCEPSRLCLDNSFCKYGEICGENLTLHISGALLPEKGSNILFEGLELRFEKFRLDSAFLCSRRILDFKANIPKAAKGRRLYRSETEDFSRRLTGEEWDFIRFEYSEKNDRCNAAFDIVFSGGEMFTVNISCGSLSAQTDKEGIKISKEKNPLKERFFGAFTANKRKRKKQ